ncbi:hypothetical protein A33M_0710 [Rhodovulum sp. PH10]|uniref:nucleotidyltransferase family protein n=1 Tax=Rhodovulum sp. PH10 TaxID=1187851 RepID=UPI00027C2CB3|nr:nucleotidyltransferase domain-containing protein [Rhodovulum sp. PH10]EJW09998.1 hypothetical protein A33M_0710 [Rhodovulum sp. PH10]
MDEATVSTDPHAEVIARTKAVCGRLAELGVTARIFGSLARGEFRQNSDIDFLVVACPARLKYAIEGLVEDGLGGLRFDVVYLDEVPPHKVARFIREAIDAERLR